MSTIRTLMCAFSAAYLLVAPAHSQGMSCAPTEEVENVLHTRFNAVPLFQGLTDNDVWLIRVFVGIGNKQVFVITASNEDGMTCIVSDGSYWQTFDLPPNL